MKYAVTQELVKKLSEGFSELDQNVWIETIDSLLEAKKLDPVGKEDDDVDNDGDSDESDDYLKNRRKKVSDAMKKEK